MTITQAYCRRKAAEFYYTEGRATCGYVVEWIESGLDDRQEIDPDVKEAADLLWKVAQEAAKYGIAR